MTLVDVPAARRTARLDQERAADPDRLAQLVELARAHRATCGCTGAYCVGLPAIIAASGLDRDQAARLLLGAVAALVDEGAAVERRAV